MEPITTREGLELKLLQREYATLSNLWKPKSTHKTHLLISQEMTRVLNEIRILKTPQNKTNG